MISKGATIDIGGWLRETCAPEAQSQPIDHQDRSVGEAVASEPSRHSVSTG